MTAVISLSTLKTSRCPPGMVAHAYNLNTLEREGKMVFEASLRYKVSRLGFAI